MHQQECTAPPAGIHLAGGASTSDPAPIVLTLLLGGRISHRLPASLMQLECRIQAARLFPWRDNS